MITPCEHRQKGDRSRPGQGATQEIGKWNSRRKYCNRDDPVRSRIQIKPVVKRKVVKPTQWSASPTPETQVVRNGLPPTPRPIQDHVSEIVRPKMGGQRLKGEMQKVNDERRHTADVRQDAWPIQTTQWMRILHY